MNTERVMRSAFRRWWLAAAWAVALPAWGLGHDPVAEASWWQVTATMPGMYRLEFSNNALRVSRQGNNPGGLQNAGLTADLAQPVGGDFETRVAFADARIEGGLNQIELQASFADGSIFFVVRDRDGSGSHIWAPGVQGNAACGNAGVISLRRSGGRITGFCNDVPIGSGERKAALTGLKFVLQNNGTNDPISTVFRDWQFSAERRPAWGGGTPGLIASYDLDGDARDSSGHQRHGRNEGGTPTTDRHGRPSGAMLFNGRAFLELPLDINPGALPQLSFTAWVRADDASPVRQVMSHDDGGYDRSLGIDYRGGGNGWSSFTGSGVLGRKSVEMGRWVFVAGVWDQAARKVRLHVDDQVFERDSQAGSSGNKLNLGRNPGFGEYFVGAIDEARFYDRALSAEEIALLAGRAPPHGGRDYTSAPPVAAPPQAATTLDLAGLEWLGTDEDKVGDWGNGRPNGVPDGHLRLVLDSWGAYTVNSISLWSANERGEKTGGQVWHTQSGQYWMLGVVRDGRQLNASHVTRLGDFSGRAAFDLYANSSGWFNPGQWFLLEVVTGDGRTLSKTLQIAPPAFQGGRDYSSRITAPVQQAAPSEPAKKEDKLKGTVKKLKDLFKF